MCGLNVRELRVRRMTCLINYRSEARLLIPLQTNNYVHNLTQDFRDIHSNILSSMSDIIRPFFSLHVSSLKCARIFPDLVCAACLAIETSIRVSLIATWCFEGR
jgi:hypothetical protein